MNFLADFVREFLLAVQFFTRIPVTGRLAEWVGFSPERLRTSAGHLPGVGIVVGLVAALVYVLLQALLPEVPMAPLVAAALSTAATVLLTGGFHEDGLADVADGLGGSLDRDRALEIMKDSRVGAFGAMALVLALLAKVGLIAVLGSVEVSTIQTDGSENWGVSSWSGIYAGIALVAAHVVSRGLPLLVIHLLPHVGDSASSKSRPLAEQIAPATLLVALIWCVAVVGLSSLAIDIGSLLAACGFSVVALLWMAYRFKRRLHGFTGDCLGATQQVCEIAFYLGLVVAL